MPKSTLNTAEFATFCLREILGLRKRLLIFAELIKMKMEKQ